MFTPQTWFGKLYLYWYKLNVHNWMSITNQIRFWKEKKKIRTQNLEYFTLVHNIHVMLLAFRYHVYKLKNLKKTLGGVLLLVKLQAVARNFTKRNTPPWVLFTIFKLSKKFYQIAQSIAYNLRNWLKTDMSSLPFDEYIKSYFSSSFHIY